MSAPIASEHSLRPSARERLGKIALAIAPVLKQVVLAGPPVVDLLLNDPAVPLPPTNFAADATLQLLSTAMVDRIGADLQKLGLVRTGRTPHGDKWQIGDDLSIELIQVRAEDDDPTASLARIRYASHAAIGRR